MLSEVNQLSIKEHSPPLSDFTKIKLSRRQYVGNEAKDRGLVEVVVAATDVEAVVELLRTIAELTPTPSLEL
jgi:hypothetical protein